MPGKGELSKCSWFPKRKLGGNHALFYMCPVGSSLPVQFVLLKYLPQRYELYVPTIPEAPFSFSSPGAIRVYFEAIRGNITALQPDQGLATPGLDFIGRRRNITIGDNVDVGSIPVWVLDDNIPELGEVFLVNITRVELVDPSQFNNTVPPLLGSHRVSQITLSPNDNPHGVFRFPQAR